MKIIDTKKKASYGFTLIELLIVVAIIAILASAVIITITPGERMLDARNATRRSHMSAIGTALHLETAEGTWTSVASSTCVGASYTSFTTGCATAIGLGEAPIDPQTGNLYETQENTAGGVTRVNVRSSSTDPVLVLTY